MRLKSFTANSMRDAMEMVRDSLGEDAIIVTTREMKGGQVRLTAAIDQNNKISAPPTPLFSQNINDEIVEDFEEEEEDVETLSEAEYQNPVFEAPTKSYAWQPDPMQDIEEDPDDFLAQWLEDSGETLEDAPDVFETPDNTKIIETITDTMLRHRFPTRVSEKIITTAALIQGKSLHETLAEAIATHFDFAPLPETAHDKPIILVGPPGAGKTLNAAKIAARAVMNGLKPVIITTDIVRAGGVEMLSAFLKVMDIKLHEARDAKALKNIITTHKDADQIIIDTGGLNPFDPYEMKDLSKLLRVCDMDPILVLPAGGDAEESAEIALTFEILGVKRIYPTRLDFARRLGGVMSAADRGNLSFVGASHTHRIPEGILNLTPEVIANLLIPRSPNSV